MSLKKRGAGGMMYTIIKVVFGVAFALLLMWYAYEKGTGLDFEKAYLAKDIAATINALYGLPGNAVVDYDNAYLSQFKNKYDIKASASIVEVKKHPDAPGSSSGPLPMESAAVPATYPYGEAQGAPGGTPVYFNLEAPPYIAFLVTRGVIEVSKTATAAQIMGCPEAETKADIKTMAILLEPGQYSGEKGNTADTLEEYKLTKQIADLVAMQCTAKGYTCKVIQQQDITSKIDEIKSAKKDMLISIHIGSGTQSENPAVIITRISDLKSSKLACLLSNSFRKDYDPVQTKSVEVGTLGAKDNLKVLGAAPDIPSASIEIGNINKKDFMTDPAKLAGIATSIILSAEKYYE